jgi:alkaline phosphatase D
MGSKSLRRQAGPAGSPLAPGRRKFIRQLGIAGGLALAPGLIRPLRAQWGVPAAPSPIFTLGVASGDPGEDSVVLWTRLAPDPLNGGGMGRSPVEVIWQLATDPSMNDVIRAGSVTAYPRDGHAVSVNVDGLNSDAWYYYQFSYAGEQSRIGRTRTFPPQGATPAGMRFALVSCQDFEAGYYAAYRDISTLELDFVVHVGDYIYEGAANPDVPAERRHTGGEITSVTGYRNRYALYRLDPDLQDAHAAFPFIVTWDDHEVDNNYAGVVPEDDQTAQEFLRRRANAYQVYAETMPLRPIVRERNGSMNLYRSLKFGDLAEFFMLDSRQVRSDQPCGDGLGVLQNCPAILDPAATMLGDEQEAWLFRNLRNSRATWNVLAQQVMMMRWDLGILLGADPPLNAFLVDAWDGYQVPRDRIMAFLADNQIPNPVVLTGDIHSSWAADLKADFTDPGSQIVGAELVCSGVTSAFGDAAVPPVERTLPSNPHIRFFDGLHRGYVLCTVTPDSWRADYRAVTRVPDPIFTVPSADIPVFDLASFRLTAGQPGLTEIL